MAYDLSIHLGKVKDIKALGFTKGIFVPLLLDRYGSDRHGKASVQNMIDYDDEWHMLGMLAAGGVSVLIPLLGSRCKKRRFKTQLRGGAVILSRVLFSDRDFDDCQDFLWSKNIPYTWRDAILGR